MSRTIGSVRAHHPLHQLCIGQEGNARQRLPVSPCRQVVLLLGTEDVLAGGEPDNPLAGVLLRQLEGDEGLPCAGGVDHGGAPVFLHHAWPSGTPLRYTGTAQRPSPSPSVAKSVLFGAHQRDGHIYQKKCNFTLDFMPKLY